MRTEGGPWMTIGVVAGALVDMVTGSLGVVLGLH
jgi:hypothetical protein